MSKNFRDLSKQGWNGDATIENINAGSLQRIADATEIMAKNYIEMQNSLDWYKRQYAEDRTTIKGLRHSQAAYKAHITRLRNKLAEVTDNAVPDM